jgi:hypothetical protein
MVHTKSRYKLERELCEALNEIERLERPKQMKSEREAKLVVAALERPGHPAFAATDYTSPPNPC